MINFKKKLHSNLLNIFKKNILTNYRVIIKLKSPSPKLIKRLKNSAQCKIIHILENVNILCLIITHRLLSNLIEYPEINYISLDAEIFLCANKTLSNIKTPDSKIISYNSNLTGKNITVGLIDSGIYPLENFTKPKNRIKLFKDLINDYIYPYDDNGHGTAMCSIIGDKFIYKNNIIKNASECDFCVIKAFDKYNKSYCSLIFKALDLLYENSTKLNLQLLCLPFELNEFNEFILTIFQYFFDELSKQNIIITIPLGNNSSNYTSLKGLSLLNNCITIGGLNLNESSYGISNKKLLKPTLISIYENIYLSNIDPKYVPERNNQYIYPPKIKNSFVEYFGTSCSCAYICSLLTLLKQKNISINIRDSLSLLKLCCNKIQDVDASIQGLGTVNVNQLLE